MALDHTRDYFHQYSYLHDATDLAYTSVPIFFTRWITHFCAPAFMLLSGISAFLYQTKNGKGALSTFLITRGLWLLFLELFYVSLMWTFNPSYPAFFLQAIWGFGASMITLAILIHLPSTNTDHYRSRTGAGTQYAGSNQELLFYLGLTTPAKFLRLPFRSFTVLYSIPCHSLHRHYRTGIFYREYLPAHCTPGAKKKMAAQLWLICHPALCNFKGH